MTGDKTARRLDQECFKQTVPSTGTQCAWQAASNAGWITITSNGVGIGTGVVGFSVAANPTGSGRKGAITVAGLTFSVKQKGN